ncbi:hypothetical protein ACFL02_07030, partial [Planctomycetota bacterium]
MLREKYLMNWGLMAVILMMMLGLAGATALGADIYVDGANAAGPWDGTKEHPYQYIQDGIDNAAINDTVLVAEGTYNENLVWVAKSIALVGERVDDTIIDGGNIDCCLIMTNVPETASIEGFTFTHGNGIGGNGGGIFCITSSPNITDCNFEENSAGWGGGMCNYLSSPTLNNCSFNDNSAGDSGGGLLNFQSSPVLSNCKFNGNSALYGGGMDNFINCNPVLSDCKFIGNSAG